MKINSLPIIFNENVRDELPLILPGFKYSINVYDKSLIDFFSYINKQDIKKFLFLLKKPLKLNDRHSFGILLTLEKFKIEKIENEISKDDKLKTNSSTKTSEKYASITLFSASRIIVQSSKKTVTKIDDIFEYTKIGTLNLCKSNFMINKDKIIDDAGATDNKLSLIDSIEIALKKKTLPSNYEDKMGDIRNYYDAPNTNFADAFAHFFLIDNEIKQFLIIENNPKNRLKLLIDIFSHSVESINNSEINKKINDSVKQKISKQQKEYYLREQIKAMQDELNTLSGTKGNNEDLESKINDNPYPKNIKIKAREELRKLKNTPTQSADYNIIKTYIEYLLSLPYWEKDNEEIDIKKTKKALDTDHWGLKKPKQRIIEYLAVRKSNPLAKNPILAFVGPPGTGKTTLVNSISKSLNRKYIKISLGGVRDEAEIRGHRRTYIAAMPGKIIQAMKKAKVVNPIILLDEIDKMSSDFRGDPISAMLEVLDYEQNASFQDHYLEEEYDLSNVMFIATANDMNYIPEPLYDRLEIIELSSYTEIEKIQIAKKYLIEKVSMENNIRLDKYDWPYDGIKFIINHYTMEAGVRQLRRKIDEISRKILLNNFGLKTKFKFKVIDEKIVKKLLGKETYYYTEREKKSMFGVVNGLAWTQYGGDILPIETTFFKGEGKLHLTGQLKDVMRESAEIALSFIKSNISQISSKNGKLKLTKDELKEKVDFFKDNDIHIHSPDGATPKDGPSAGVTFITSILSKFLNINVSNKIGMTGEVTLNGKVLTIGGLREKLISADRSGLKTIFIPNKNVKDLVDVPKEVKDALEIISVETYWEIFDKIFNS